MIAQAVEEQAKIPTAVVRFLIGTLRCSSSPNKLHTCHGWVEIWNLLTDSTWKAMEKKMAN